MDLPTFSNNEAFCVKENIDEAGKNETLPSKSVSLSRSHKTTNSVRIVHSQMFACYGTILPSTDIKTAIAKAVSLIPSIAVEESTIFHLFVCF